MLPLICIDTDNKTKKEKKMLEKEEKLLKAEGVIEYVQVSKAKLLEMVKQGDFPSGQKLGGNRLWYLSDVQNWINNFKQKREA